MKLFYYSFFATIVISLGYYADQVIEAQVMESPSYQIQSDSINVGGGFSTSTSFQLESTVGEVATGRSTSSAYNLFAGYQQMQQPFLSLTDPADVFMDPDIGGITGGESNGSTTVTATTDNGGGYQLTIESSQAPAMQFGAFTLSDYAPTSTVPDVSFATDAAEAHFGFSVFGVDAADDFKYSGTGCGSGASTELKCWDGLSPTPTVIAERNSSNQPAGSETTIYFKVGVDSAATVNPGTYTATSTITLLPL